MYPDRKLYRDVYGRTGSIIRRDEEEYIIVRFNGPQVALFKCDVEKEIKRFKDEYRYFVNLSDPYMGHAMELLDAGQKLKKEWIWKPIEYIEDFEVIYDY